MRFSAVKGVQDILPPDVYVWQRAEAAAARVFGSYGFHEVRPPVMEFTEVFVRSIGETSDIVSKEMYTFDDRGGRSITLRPEGTAPIVRGYVEHHLYNLPSPQKFFYRGPMFRYERPQKGRLRQFYQIGAEAFGSPGPAMDAEMLSMLGRFLEEAGVGGLSFEVNSIGCEQCRPAFREALRDFFRPRLPALCPDCARRFEHNPLRILDCKVPACVEQKGGAPKVSDFLCPDCAAHFSELRRMLDALGVPHVVNPAMVRGLDYYTRTTFEVTTDRLGAQNAVAAGGRYDRLVEEFGGPPTPAIGFALGMERLVALMKEAAPEAPSPAVFIAFKGAEAGLEALKLADALRGKGVWAELGQEGASLKSQFRRADRLGATLVFVIGEDELREGAAGWKDLRDGSSGRVAMGEAVDFFRQRDGRAPSP
ncbi:MAG: histidine--tRNA ligase [Thermodesulfovibrionales bacterium]